MRLGRSGRVLVDGAEQFVNVWRNQ